VENDIAGAGWAYIACYPRGDLPEKPRAAKEYSSRGAFVSGDIRLRRYVADSLSGRQSSLTKLACILAAYYPCVAA